MNKLITVGYKQQHEAECFNEDCQRSYHCVDQHDDEIQNLRKSQMSEKESLVQAKYNSEKVPNVASTQSQRTICDRLSAPSKSRGCAKGLQPKTVVCRSFSVRLGDRKRRMNANSSGLMRSNSIERATTVPTNTIWMKYVDWDKKEGENVVF